MKGHIHAIESMGLVDGPGIRTVVFLQGCSLRCQFCHNPDTWDTTKGETVDSEELVQKILRFKPYFKRSGGGVTFSGGEPLLQPDFLIAMLRRCKEEGIHTCIDTAGVGIGRYEEVLAYTDLVLYDVKATTPEAYKQLCGSDIQKTEDFQRSLAQSGTDTIIRAVIMPGVNDSGQAMTALREYVETRIPTAIKVELLPYHKMGVHKYAAIGSSDPLADTPAMDRDKTKALWELYFKDFKNKKG